MRVHGHGEEVHGLVGLHGDQLEHVQGFHVEGGDHEGTTLVWTIPATAMAIVKTTASASASPSSSSAQHHHHLHHQHLHHEPSDRTIQELSPTVISSYHHRTHLGATQNTLPPWEVSDPRAFMLSRFCACFSATFSGGFLMCFLECMHSKLRPCDSV